MRGLLSREGRTSVEKGKLLGHENLGEVVELGGAVVRVKVGEAYPHFDAREDGWTRDPRERERERERGKNRKVRRSEGEMGGKEGAPPRAMGAADRAHG